MDVKGNTHTHLTHTHTRAHTHFHDHVEEVRGIGPERGIFLNEFDLTRNFCFILLTMTGKIIFVATLIFK